MHPNELLGREPISLALPDLSGRVIVVTGSSGFIGSLAVQRIEELGGKPIRFDLDDGRSIMSAVDLARVDNADACLHFAANKHAPLGEDIPAEIADLNIRGTANVCEAFESRVVFSSTCKAADPFGPYGMSKAIGERVVLNAGGKVVRFVNVIGSTGAILEIWAKLPQDQPLPVTDCCRMFMTPQEAVDLALAALDFPRGRYALDVPSAAPMTDFAARAYPDRELAVIPLRRGDRPVERLVGAYEQAEAFAPGIIRINHLAD